LNTLVRRRLLFPGDMKAVREQIGLLQGEFARLLRVSTKTRQDWEHSTAETQAGPLAALLEIVLTAPGIALKALNA
jgi:DNA-binding transcriptional regulator YiaG